MLKAEVSTVTDDPTIAPAEREHAGERAEPRPGTRSRRPWPRLEAPALREIILALALLFCYGFFRQVPAWNEYSRYDLVQALVQDGTTSIDRYHENTGDKAFYDGHYFSDKAPGTAFLGVPIYVLLALGSEAAGAGAPDPETAVQALAFGVSGVATALLVLLLLRFLRPTVGERWALVISLGYGFGSLAFPFGAMFFGHAASAFFLFASFYLLWRWRADGRAWRPLLAGFLAGWAVITEIPVVLGVAVLGGYALWLGRGHALRFVAGGIPVALVFAAYNWISFGGPFDIGYQYATLFGEQNRQGIVSIVWPSWATAAELLVGPRGLLRLAPWFLLAPLGMLAYRRRAVRAEVVVSVAVCVVFLVYNSGALNPLGGWTPGPRYLLPALPFAAVLVALAPIALRQLIIGLIAIATVLVFVATSTMANAPELYGDPLYELWLPRLFSGDIADTIAWARWGLHGIQPLAVLGLGLAVAAAALLATFRSGSVARRFAGLGAFSMALLTVAFAVPAAPSRAIDLAVAGWATRPAGSVTTVEVGSRLVVTEDREATDIWAQIENRGPALDDTRVVFAIVGPDGSPTWTAWYDEVDWQEGSRRRVSTVWDTERVAAGDYRLQVSVVSADQRTVYSSFDHVAVIRVHR